MLDDAKIAAFVATANPARARDFYEGTLGLRLLRDDPYALVFDANGTQLRIQKVEKFQPAPFTALGWQVTNVRETVQGLSARGVSFEQFAFLHPDELGIWTAPDGTQVAWFKDPDGNLLSLGQHIASRGGSTS